MLNYNVRGENIEVTPAIREYVESKVGKVEKYFDEVPEANAHVNLKIYSDRTGKAEVTIPLPNIVLRAEETSPDLYGSIDLVSDKLERQMRKYKTKINRKFRRQQTGLPDAISPDLLEETKDLDDEINEEVNGGVDESEAIRIVRTKRFDLKPMNAEEAVLQMEMLGHDFFVFLDADTDSTNIVYKRDDGDYGLIETDEIE
ncbi:ribosome hibernation-promoting factor, HPF/YfiA family [Atopostipes suicloacalis]|uniref:ribosome hibernation-promoting factor, HPF/YfiA family n=1 Tax=Atopostipes suicloacalis TaxID=180295 RepID=UPI000934AB24|nr:ribosome-associated translation inhibitor RaiA [Atopostipes suicloacalis]